MMLAKRLAIILSCTAFYWAAALAVPELLDSGTLKWFSGAFGFLLTLEFFAFRQLNATTGTGILGTTEIERLNLKRAEIRSRIYLTSSLIAASSVTLFLVALLAKDASRYSWLSLAVGFLLGVAINYVVVIVGWINQLSSFSDHLRELEQERKDFDDQVKRLADAAKAAGAPK